MSNVVLSLEKIKKSFHQGKNKLSILSDANLEIKQGQLIALVGPSGSGKTTLLQIAGLLDKTEGGKIIINGKDCAKLNDKERTIVRRHDIGFVYQFHHLLPDFSAQENVVLPQLIAGIAKEDANNKAKSILKYLGLSSRLNHRPAELSGGEQQRVAIARAIINNPSLLLADEPTGNLDPHTADEVFELLVKTVKSVNIAVLVVTHNNALAQRMDKIMTIEDGQIIEVTKK